MISVQNKKLKILELKMFGTCDACDKWKELTGAHGKWKVLSIATWGCGFKSDTNEK